MLKLYYASGACSLAVHAALHEARIEHTVEKVDLAAGANQDPLFLAKNPWGRVPTLESDGGLLTEVSAILSLIAERVPERELLPPVGSPGRLQALEWMSLLSSTLHVAFRPAFRPGRLAQGEAAQADVASTGLAALDRTLALFDDWLGDGPYALGERFSLVDLHLLVFLLWVRRPILAGKLDRRPRLDGLHARLVGRPSVRQAMEVEGLLP